MRRPIASCGLADGHFENPAGAFTLLDECIDRRLAIEIEGHEVVTVPQAGWAGIQNGELLRLAQVQFNIFVTVDRNLSFQQHLPQFTIAANCSSSADQSLERPSTLGAPTPTKAFGRSKRPSDAGEPVTCSSRNKVILLF